jgi:hypothetical protein
LITPDFNENRPCHCEEAPATLSACQSRVEELSATKRLNHRGHRVEVAGVLKVAGIYFFVNVIVDVHGF